MDYYYYYYFYAFYDNYLLINCFLFSIIHLFRVVIFEFQNETVFFIIS